MVEKWKNIYHEKYKNRYEVSTKGRIYSLHNKKVMNQCLRGDYMCVSLSRKGVSKTYSVHRLVANTFLGETSDKVVNHKNGNKIDNRLKNLEFVTQSQNMQHASKTGLIKKTTAKAVNQYDLKGNFINEYKSIKLASKETDTNDSAISRVCLGKIDSAGGYKWEYVKEGKKIKPIDENIKRKKHKLFPDYYVYENGQISVIKSGRIKVLRKGTAGYLRTDLSHNGKSKTIDVHRLVAAVFIKNPDKKKFVNHIDGNKLNNHVDNLEWVTPSENNYHHVKLSKKKNKKDD